MTSPRTPDELEELLAAYALDAVDADEAAEVERYLRENPRAREEVDRHREVAALLGTSGGPAPEGLWQVIATAIADEERAPEPSGELARVLELPTPRRTVPARVLAGVTAVAAAAVLVLGVALVRQQSEFDDDLDRIEDAMADGAVLQAANAALLDDDTVEVELASPTGGDDHVTLAITDDGQGFLVATELAPLGEDQTYQLWAITDDAVVSAGVLGADPGTRAFAAGDAQGYAITIERAGGVVSSEQDAYLVGTVA
jgi:anti-sigma-K factor RskA